MVKEMASDESEDIEEIRRRKLEQLKKLEEARKAEEQLKAMLRQVVDQKAYERLMNVSMANKELYLIASKQLIALYNRVGRKLSDDEVLKVLRMLKASTERETRIVFREK